jgi:ABC-type lipoprotein release transport system permease subunit
MTEDFMDPRVEDVFAVFLCTDERPLQLADRLVEKHDAMTFIAVVTLISTIGVLALYIPARRVARIDPVIALRAE